MIWIIISLVITISMYCEIHNYNFYNYENVIPTLTLTLTPFLKDFSNEAK
jgi:hypothetical protein